MKSETKQNLIDLSEIIDSFRVVPRIILIAYGWLVYHVVEWFMVLKVASTQQATLVSTVVGMAAVVIGLYNNSGRKYNK